MGNRLSQTKETIGYLEHFDVMVSIKQKTRFYS